MKWIDTYEIVDALLEKYPEKNPEKILFTDLRNLVSNLKGFDDELDKCNERILEAIQALWIDELD
ncbi:MAG: Fe-S cluster assembly protein IscX [Pseudomonadota bacterium]|jgi:FeS assembly protein IscX|nr:Fe-S cluster assembly protein IscX [SAR86 cluster bacterium]MEC7269202.1 Fe-S cluster assembly protein IscX [Pseudomonadota bacterium]MDC3012677.1 Fe-S cluster assembly protein IscX [SAR86 cluster bacterium]MEC7465730.1 Fe-S cluster assembly protein IscX [Pseudomonadota bacterium]MEC7787155.1 Fe-S cluster assembly protein IscX [Pseudomonadota bacterium]|tara:strand:+ start:187 stop:381 length:195 start_codon:yes stop_codon:yes gene_type:complete